MSTSEQAVIASIPHTVGSLRAAFAKERPGVDWRRSQLLALRRLLTEHREEICAAVSQDLGVLPEIVNLGEVGAAVEEIDLALRELGRWMAPERKKVPAMILPGSAYVQKEPYGVVLIISPWNYPFRLMLLPLVGAIAAGNAVVTKPSEVSSRSAALFKRLSDQHLCRTYIACVEGGVDVSSALLRERFDYVFYTGNTAVGKIVMKAAAEHLTPVTLELGGKSPVFIDAKCNLDVATDRLLYGKFTNVGQTCVAPDYILADRRIKEPLVAMLKEKLKKWYTDNPEQSESYSRVINERHTARLKSYLDEVRDRIVVGGRVDVAKRFVEPTLVDEPSPHVKLMQEEIFGPILPILGVESAQEAVSFINARPKPLALYVFSSDKKTADFILNRTSSGGACVNGTIFHIVLPEMEFGGVGPSGMGAYNGKHSFDTFTHRRGVLERATWLDAKLIYPPYTPKKRRMLKMAVEGFKVPTSVKLAAGAAIAGAAAFGFSRLSKL